MQKQNALARQELRKKNMQAAGLLSEKFPRISNLKIKMTYFQDLRNPVLMKRTVNFFPTSYAYFNMDCMNKECENGSFDLTRKVREMVKGHKKVLKGSMCCSAGKKEGLTQEHASIEFEISINYGRRA